MLLVARFASIGLQRYYFFFTCASARPQKVHFFRFIVFCRVCFSHRDLKVGVFMGYSQSIWGVFTGYSYVSVMYRLCVGYVSVIYRSILGAGRGGFGNLVERNIESPTRKAREILINLTYKVINSPVRLTPVVGVTRGPHIATLRALNLK